MDLAGTAKMRYRLGIMNDYKLATGRTFIPRDEVIVTLGAQYARGGNLIETSELATFLRLHMAGDEPWISTSQYVNVEWKPKIHKQNLTLKGPTCYQGDFCAGLWRHVSEDGRPVAVVNADFMCNAETALGWMKKIFEALSYTVAPVESGRTIIAVNVVGDQRYYRTAFGHKFPPALKCWREHGWFRALEQGGKDRDPLKLIGDFQYPNKEVGSGARSTLMHTLTFSWGLKRDLSGIRGWESTQLPAKKEHKSARPDGRWDCSACGEKEVGYTNSQARKEHNATCTG